VLLIASDAERAIYSVAGWNNLLNFRDIVVLFIEPKVNLAID